MFTGYSQFHPLVEKSNLRIKYLSQQELESFFECIQNPRDRTLFGIIYLYGLRVSEATLLKLEDVDLQKKRIFIQRVKGGIGGERPLFKSIESLLRRYLKRRNPRGDSLFTGKQGNLGRERIQQLFKQYAQEAGLGSRFSVHCLRHSIATHLLDAGEGIEFVRDHLGHKNIQNTMIYAQITDKSREEAFRRVERSPEIARF
jgi:integrase/recombinase XerD